MTPQPVAPLGAYAVSAFTNAVPAMSRLLISAAHKSSGKTTITLGLCAALAERGLRTPFFGPLSGIEATVGGSLSQNGAFFGSSMCPGAKSPMRKFGCCA